MIQPSSCTSATAPCAGELLASVIETAILVPRTAPGDRILRGRFISLFHRMVRLLLCCREPIRTSASGPWTCDVRAASARLLHLILAALTGAAVCVLSRYRFTSIRFLWQ